VKTNATRWARGEGTVRASGGADEDALSPAELRLLRDLRGINAAAIRLEHTLVEAHQAMLRAQAAARPAGSAGSRRPQNTDEHTADEHSADKRNTDKGENRSGIRTDDRRSAGPRRDRA
jgi:hypothetical protein